MSNPNKGSRALGGGPLFGDHIVRLAYLDESGVANPEHEPWVVVAGVLIDADRQWRHLEKALAELADKYAPPSARENFVFHAAELWSGGKTLVREEYPAERRWAALKELCELPEKFGFPVVFGAVHRKTYTEVTGGDLSQSEVTIDAQLVGFTLCMTLLERYMRALPNKDEVATITVEHNSQTISLFRKQQRRMKSTSALEGMNPAAAAFWPVTKIIDTVNYCEKNDTSLLQIADAAAFVIRKKLERNKNIDPYWSLLSDQVMAFPPTVSATFATDFDL